MSTDTEREKLQAEYDLARAEYGRGPRGRGAEWYRVCAAYNRAYNALRNYDRTHGDTP